MFEVVQFLLMQDFLEVFASFLLLGNVEVQVSHNYVKNFLNDSLSQVFVNTICIGFIVIQEDKQNLKEKSETLEAEI